MCQEGLSSFPAGIIIFRVEEKLTRVRVTEGVLLRRLRKLPTRCAIVCLSRARHPKNRRLPYPHPSEWPQDRKISSVGNFFAVRCTHFDRGAHEFKVRESSPSGSITLTMSL